MQLHVTVAFSPMHVCVC